MNSTLAVAPTHSTPTPPLARASTHSFPTDSMARERNLPTSTTPDAAPRILVVDDERDLLDLLSFNLRRAGYDVSTAATGKEALAAIAARVPDLVLLDVMLPEMSGTAVAAAIRARPESATVPIIMLTAKSQESDQLVGLAAGADDYVTKPFSVKVLTARVAALLRRSARPADSKELRLAGVTLNLDTHEAFVDETPAKFTLTEFRILAALIAANGRVLSRHALMSKAMGPGVTVTERTIDVHVTSIRKRLGRHASIIKTVRGVGYRVTDDPEGASA